MKVPGGCLLGSATYKLGVYFFDEETDELTELIINKRAGFHMTTPLENDPDGSFIIYGGSTTGLLKYNPVTRQITDLTPGAPETRFYYDYLEYQGIQIYGGDTIPVVVLDTVENTIEIGSTNHKLATVTSSDATIPANASKAFSYYLNQYDCEELEDVRFYFPIRNDTTLQIAIDVRAGQRTVTMAARGSFYSPATTGIVNQETTHGMLFYSVASTTVLGFMYYNKNTREFTSLLAAGYNWTTSFIMAGHGIIFVPYTQGATQFFDLNANTMTQLTVGHSYDTFITQPNNTNYIIFFHSMNSPYAGAANTTAGGTGIYRYDKSSKTATALTAGLYYPQNTTSYLLSNYFYKNYYSVRGSKGIVFWTSNNAGGTSTSSQPYNTGINFYNFSTSTFTQVTNGGTSWNYYEIDSTSGRGSNYSGIAFNCVTTAIISGGTLYPGVWFWCDRNNTFVQSTGCTTGHNWQFYSPGWSDPAWVTNNPALTYCFATSATSTNVGLYVCTMTSNAQTATQIITRGYNWNIIVPIAINNNTTGGSLISSSNASSLGLFSWTAYPNYAANASYCIEQLTTGYYYNANLQVTKAFGILWHKGYNIATATVITGVWRYSASGTYMSSGLVVKVIDALLGHQSTTADWHLQAMPLYASNGTVSGVVIGSCNSTVAFRGLWQITSTTATKISDNWSVTNGYFLLFNTKFTADNGYTFQILSAYPGAGGSYSWPVFHYNGTFTLLNTIGGTSTGGLVNTSLRFTNTKNSKSFYLVYNDSGHSNNTNTNALHIVSASTTPYVRCLQGVGGINYTGRPRVVLQFNNAAIIATKNVLTDSESASEYYHLMDYDSFNGTNPEDISITLVGSGNATTYGGQMQCRIIHQEKEALDDPENVVIFAPQSHTYLYKWDAATRKLTWFTNRAYFNELEKLENENGDFLLLSNGINIHNFVKWDNTAKTLLDPFGKDSNISPNMTDNYMNHTEKYIERGRWRYVVGYTKNRYYNYFNDISSYFIFKYDPETLDMELVKTPEVMNLNNLAKMRVLPYLQNEIIVCQHDANSKVYRINADDTIDVLSAQRFYDSEKIDPQFIRSNSMFADYTEHSGFGLIYSGDTAGTPVYKYPSMKRINTKMSLDAGTTSNSWPHMMTKNEYTISDSVIYNHINELTTFSADAFYATYMKGATRPSKKQFFLMLPTLYRNRAYFFKTRAYSDVE
jgi:hypothetical protein